MPGAYTHLSLVQLLTSGNALSASGLDADGRKALLEYPEICQLGAISPDYPYLNLITGKKASEHWANAMHHKYGTLTRKNILHVGIEYLRNLAGDEKLQCVAWFLGYASHLTADVTCHPVTNLLVGDYEADNQVAHRVSEMNQDVYIFSTRLDGDVRKSEHIKNVIGSCSSSTDRNRIKPSIEKMWKTLLRETFPEINNKFVADIGDWHSSVQFWISDVGEELSIIPSRHIRGFFEDRGVAYPRAADNRYIESLETPKGRMSYDMIFDFAKENIVKVWRLIVDGVFLNDTRYADRLKIWNLDTGQEVKTPRILWEGGL